jgi:PAS domain S-box-containing protein
VFDRHRKRAQTGYTIANFSPFGVAVTDDVVDALRESEKFLRLSQKASGVGSWEWDITTGLIRWSDEMCRIHGLEPHEFDGRLETAGSFFHPDDMPQFESGIRLLLKEGIFTPLQYRIRTRDGRMRYLRAAGEVICDEAGNPIRSIGTNIDVTAEVEREAELRASEARYRAIIQAIPDLMLRLDAEGKILDYHASRPEELVVFPEEFIGKRIDELLPPKVGELFREHRQRTLEQQQSQQFEFTLDFPNRDSMSFEARMMASGERELVAILRNITDRLKLEERLRQSQKMQALGQLAGGIAHDFNNLLTVISGYSEKLLHQLTPSNALWDDINAIHTAGTRAARLTQQLLLFSRKAVPERTRIDLNDVVQHTNRMLRPLIGEDVIITLVLAPSLRHIKADAGQMAQVIMNLCLNARDAMPEGGKLTIETRNVSFNTERRVRGTECRPGHYTQLLISDTGCGMAPEVLNRVFEPFFTTKGPGKGTGLGLATVHGIVQESGGYISVTSEVGKGTSFNICLPSEMMQEPARAASDSAPEMPGGTETILLVEDEEGVRRVARLALEMHGYRVLQAKNGRDAIRLLESHPERIDMIVTDVVMPEMNGRQLAETLLPRLPGCKVMFMSGYNDDAVLRHGVLAAKTAFLQKPFTQAELLQKVRATLDGAK